jgi:hypothetical protein
MAIRSAAKYPVLTGSGKIFGISPGGICPKYRLSEGIGCAKPVVNNKENKMEKTVVFI